MVNGSHSHMIKGLKPGMSYRVRVVARDPADLTVHSTDEVSVLVPGEAACLRIDVFVFIYFFAFLIFPIPFLLCLIIRNSTLHSVVYGS